MSIAIKNTSPSPEIVNRFIDKKSDNSEEEIDNNKNNDIGSEYINKELHMIKKEIKTFKQTIKDITNDESIRKIHSYIDKINNRIDSKQEQVKIAIASEIKNKNKN